MSTRRSRPTSNTNPNGPGIALPDTGFNSTEKTLNYGAYLRDSYNVGFIPGLTVNAGVRWEAQQVQGADGSTQIGIYDNWAPRVGAIYDFTRKGRGKIFASYGWFYESIPMDINDRSFSGEGAILAATPGGTCMPNMAGIYDLSTCKPTTMITNAGISGGTYSSVSPGAQGHVLGGSGRRHPVRRRLRPRPRCVVHPPRPRPHHRGYVAERGLGLHHRQPGRHAGRGRHQGSSDPDHAATDPMKKAALTKELGLYQQINVGFPKPKRNYDALVLTATKRLSHNFLRARVVHLLAHAR